MKKTFLLLCILFVFVLSACSFNPGAKTGGNTQKESGVIANSETEAAVTNLLYIEDLQPGYNYGVEGVNVKSVEMLFFPEGTINEWALDLSLEGELRASGEYYVSMAGNNPYCFKLDNPNILPSIGSKRTDVITKYGSVLSNNKDLCFYDEQSDYLAVDIFGEKFVNSQVNAGRATIKIKDISIHEQTTAESYNNAVLVEAIKD